MTYVIAHMSTLCICRFKQLVLEKRKQNNSACVCPCRFPVQSRDVAAHEHTAATERRATAQTARVGGASRAAAATAAAVDRAARAARAAAVAG